MPGKTYAELDALAADDAVFYALPQAEQDAWMNGHDYDPEDAAPAAAEDASPATGATCATGAAVADRIRAVFRRYVAFHSDHEDAEAGTLALWVLHTYTFRSADTTPYLLISAPTSGAGKSRIFDVARVLAYRPFPVVDPTPASLFHVIDETCPTLLVDEVDQLRESHALRQVLNSGFQPGYPVSRCKKSYKVYCPKAFSGIAGIRPPLSEATLSRCIQIPMRRRGEGEHIEKFRYARAEKENADLRDEIFDWANASVDELADADPDMPDELTNDRHQDMWAPLFSIADMIGGTWPEDARRWAVELTRAIPADPDPGVQLLSDVKRVLDAYSGSKIPSSTLADLRDALDGREYDEDLPARRLSKRLGGFGIRPDSSPFRMGGRESTPERGFTVRRGSEYTKQWADAFQRYGLA